MANTPHLKRPTILVADIERSLTVYRDILGFTINYIKDSDSDSYSYPVFKIPNEAKIRFAALDSTHEQRCIGLTEVKGITLPKIQEPIMACMVIQVGDIKSVIGELTNIGLVCTAIKTDSNERLTFNETSFQDLDGHLVVLYEIIQEA